MNIEQVGEIAEKERRAVLRKFKSLAHEKEYGYAYDSQACDAQAVIESHFRMFHDYGDGLTQHSPDWSVQADFLADFLASLAQAMLTDDELARDLYYTIWQRPDAKHIAWAASVIYKAPKDGECTSKRRYFSAKEMKVSGSPSKQYDRRYEEIREIHDGSPDSIYRILLPEYADGLQKYIYASAIRDWMLEQDGGGYMELPAEFLRWFSDRDESLRLRNAYECCKNITESYRLRAAVESSLANYKRSVQPKEPEPAAAAPEPAAAEPDEPSSADAAIADDSKEVA